MIKKKKKIHTDLFDEHNPLIWRGLMYLFPPIEHVFIQKFPFESSVWQRRANRTDFYYFLRNVLGRWGSKKLSRVNINIKNTFFL